MNKLILTVSASGFVAEVAVDVFDQEFKQVLIILHRQVA